MEASQYIRAKKEPFERRELGAIRHSIEVCQLHLRWQKFRLRGFVEAELFSEARYMQSPQGLNSNRKLDFFAYVWVGLQSRRKSRH